MHQLQVNKRNYSKTIVKTGSLLRCALFALAGVLFLQAPAEAQIIGQSLTTINGPVRNANSFGEKAVPFGSDRIIVGSEYESMGAGVVLLLRTDGGLLTTITNPSPAKNTSFGDSIAAVGNYILVGSPNLGSDPLPVGPFKGGAFLFNTNGALITTFNNPKPNSGLLIGNYVAALGSDRVLIGTADVGVGVGGFLFNTNGTLLTTFSNLNAGNGFGASAAVVGRDKIVIGDPWRDLGATASGAANVFDTNGVLLTTITNPIVQESANFGMSVAAVGDDRFAVSAISENIGETFAGAVFIFDVQGHLLKTIINPAPSFADNFGISMASLGSDRLLIRAEGNAQDDPGAGILYLFNTDGALLKTFTNPAPSLTRFFGQAAVLDNNRIFVGAIDAARQGTGFIYTTNGTILNQLFSPILHTNTLFGSSLARFDNSRFLIGAPHVTFYPLIPASQDDGQAFLYSSDGRILAEFRSPIQEADSSFGVSVAPFAGDRVLVGSGLLDSNELVAGRAYLFGTNGGVPLTVFTNPVPVGGPAFGKSLGGVGTDMVAIGAPYASVDGSGAGAVYLFNTNGVLATTISSPTPSSGAGFGWLVAAVGDDRLVITSPWDSSAANRSGSAYLFQSDGSFLGALENPTKTDADNFGSSLAVLGTGVVAIGAHKAASGLPGEGVVYLFDVNGVLFTTITNPAPADATHFGGAIATVGTDKLVVSSLQLSGLPGSGNVYLFSTNGTLLATFSNPSPQEGDGFGASLTAFDGDRVVVGAFGYDAGAKDNGAAFVFSVPYPKLNITRIADRIELSWSTTESGIVLQQADMLNGPWSDTPEAVQQSGENRTVAASLEGATRFFRLHRQ